MLRDDHFCQSVFTSLVREARAKPNKLNSPATKRADRNPVTTPSKAAYDPTPVAAGGSKAPAIVKSTAKPSGNPIRKDVPITPEARPSSPGLVPATAARLTAGNPMLAPRVQTIIPGSTRK